MDRKLSYIQDLYASEDTLLKKIRRRALREDFPIHIHPEEGKLLQLLIQMMQTRKIVEIGTHAGYSAIWMARALPPDGILHTIEKSQKRYDLAQKTFQDFERKTLIRSHLGDAYNVLQTLKDQGPFDLVFIDADKISYLDYLEWAVQNVREGGLIIADNTLLDGAVYGEQPTNLKIAETTLQVMREFNRRLANHDHFTSLLLPTTSGLTIAFKKKTPASKKQFRENVVPSF